MAMSRERSLFAVILFVALVLSGCTSDSTPSPSPTLSALRTVQPHAPVYGTDIALRGWPTDTFACDRPDQRLPKTDPVRFDEVTHLLFCGPGAQNQTRLPNTGPRIKPVMKALAAKDDRGIYYCPNMPRDGRETTLIALASTPDQDYRVRLPAGICGSPQRDLAQALIKAGIKVPGRTTTD
ncbi:MAG: hypothetical protein ABI720_09710 [Actinomycetes bacterium]